MKKFIQKVFRGVTSGAFAQKPLSRDELKNRVEKGTDRAIKEYGYVFKKLAEYDRT